MCSKRKSNKTRIETGDKVSLGLQVLHVVRNGNPTKQGLSSIDKKYFSLLSSYNIWALKNTGLKRKTNKTNSVLDTTTNDNQFNRRKKMNQTPRKM